MHMFNSVHVHMYCVLFRLFILQEYVYDYSSPRLTVALQSWLPTSIVANQVSLL